MDIKDYHSDMKEVIELNQQLIDMAVTRQQGSKLFSPGRVVVLRDNVSLFSKSVGKLDKTFIFSIFVHLAWAFCWNPPRCKSWLQVESVKPRLILFSR